MEKASRLVVGAGRSLDRSAAFTPHQRPIWYGTMNSHLSHVSYTMKRPEGRAPNDGWGEDSIPAELRRGPNEVWRAQNEDWSNARPRWDG